jgi:hypothetical protein
MGFTSSPSMNEQFSVMILVPIIPPSSNKLLNMHWSDRTKEKAVWKRTLWAMIQGRDKQFLEACCKVKRKMRVEFTFQYRREFDTDNLNFMTKIPLDQLRHLNFLHDDSPAFCDLHVSQELINAKSTRIYLCEA